MYNETVSMMSKYEATKCPHCITIHGDQFSLIVASYIMKVQIINVNNPKYEITTNSSLPHYHMYLSAQIFHRQIKTLNSPKKAASETQRTEESRQGLTGTVLRGRHNLEGEGNSYEHFVRKR